MTPRLREIRWEIAAGARQTLRISASIRCEPDHRERPIAERLYTVNYLAKKWPDLSCVVDQLRIWLRDDPTEWDSADSDYDPAYIWGSENKMEMWGRLLGQLLVTDLFGTDLDGAVADAIGDGTEPNVRLLFALRGAEARRLPVEALMWPSRQFVGPIASEPGFSLLRESSFDSRVPRRQPQRTLRIALAGVPAAGFADQSEFARLETELMLSPAEPQLPLVFHTAGPGLCGSPAEAVGRVASLRSDVAVMWGHGVRQHSGSPVSDSVAWDSSSGSASAGEISRAVADCADVSVVAMCFSGTEGMTGEPSTVSLVGDLGAQIAVGFQGQPATTSVTALLGDLLRELRQAAADPTGSLFTGVERALHRIRTSRNDVHSVARQLVVYCSPYLTAGRTGDRLPKNGLLAPAREVELMAYRTAGQLLVTQLSDGGFVRVPLPAEPVKLKLSLSENEIRVSEAPTGLQTALGDALRLWPEMADRAITIDKTLVDRNWGLLSAILDAVIYGCEELTGSTRPSEVDGLINKARARDWGCPPGLDVIEVESGQSLCRLGRPPSGLNVRGSSRFHEAEQQALEAYLQPKQLQQLRLPLQKLEHVNWEDLNRAAWGDLDALKRLTLLQRNLMLSTSSPLLTGFVSALNDTNPYGLAIPSVTEWHET